MLINVNGGGGVKRWSKFKIGDLFNIKIGKVIDGNKANRNGEIAYITRKESDNGLDGFVKAEKDLLNRNFPVITIGNETAKPFVQSYPFFTGTKVNILLPKRFYSKYVLFFIATSLEQHKQKYSYSYTINSTRLNEQIILLPTNKDGEIDINFMETYMREKENQKIIQYLKAEID
ncbi:MAG: restriction endonuclease subunit S [Bacteroidia bacterium]|nr:restriction endonuclease subunit S [Bacteroidia bacterium]